MKLEENPTLSLSHSISALKVYSLGINRKNHGVLSRREDCYREKNGCVCNMKKKSTKKLCQKRFPRDPEEYILKKTKTKIKTKISSRDKHIRKGDEFFVPSKIVDYLFKEINEKIKSKKFN